MNENNEIKKSSNFITEIIDEDLKGEKIRSCSHTISSRT